MNFADSDTLATSTFSKFFTTLSTRDDTSSLSMNEASAVENAARNSGALICAARSGREQNARVTTREAMGMQAAKGHEARERRL